MTHTDHTSPHDEAANAVHEGRPVEAQYAKQGRGGGRIVWVLAIGLILAALATFGFWAMKSDDLASADPNIGRQVSDARTFSQDEPTVKQSPSQDPSAASRGSTADSYGDNRAPGT
ncbi:MAG TPA: hypothetical protein VD929_03295 [Caulobacteraceae bacterium]|nr:hypothetical protein [Caulobacteraceae bacterium]